MPPEHPQNRSVTKSRKSSTGTRRAGQHAARTAGRGPAYQAKPLPKAAVPALIVVAALMLIPAGWGAGVLIGAWSPTPSEDPTGRAQGTALAMLAAGGALAVVCLAMAWWVRRQHADG